MNFEYCLKPLPVLSISIPRSGGVSPEQRKVVAAPVVQKEIIQAAVEEIIPATRRKILLKLRSLLNQEKLQMGQNPFL